MSVDFALIKVLEGRGGDLSHFLSSFPTPALLRVKQVKDGSGRLEYIGYAPASATLSDPYWLIKKQVYDGAGFLTDGVLANAEAKFNKVFNTGANEYENYSYSVS